MFKVGNVSGYGTSSYGTSSSNIVKDNQVEVRNEPENPHTVITHHNDESTNKKVINNSNANRDVSDHVINNSNNPLDNSFVSEEIRVGKLKLATKFVDPAVLLDENRIYERNTELEQVALNSNIKSKIENYLKDCYELSETGKKHLSNWLNDAAAKGQDIDKHIEILNKYRFKKNFVLYLSVASSDNALLNAKSNSFFIRTSTSSGGDYTISFRKGDRPFHIRVSLNELEAQEKEFKTEGHMKCMTINPLFRKGSQHYAYATNTINS